MENLVESKSKDLAVLLWARMDALYDEIYAEKAKAEDWCGHDVCFEMAVDAYKLYENAYDILKYNVADFDAVLYSIYNVQSGIDKCYEEHVESELIENILQKDDYVAIVNLLIELLDA